MRLSAVIPSLVQQFCALPVLIQAMLVAALYFLYSFALTKSLSTRVMDFLPLQGLFVDAEEVEGLAIYLYMGIILHIHFVKHTHHL